MALLGPMVTPGGAQGNANAQTASDTKQVLGPYSPGSQVEVFVDSGEIRILSGPESVLNDADTTAAVIRQKGRRLRAGEAATFQPMPGDDHIAFVAATGGNTATVEVFANDVGLR
jgi:hypothetical protein